LYGEDGSGEKVKCGLCSKLQWHH